MTTFEAAKPKTEAKKSDAPVQASMRESSPDKVRRNPSTDQRRIRREMQKKAGPPEGVYNEDGEPLGFDYPSDPGEDDPMNGPDEDLDYGDDQDDWDDDFAHEGSNRFAITDQDDLRPLHVRVAQLHIKKGNS